MEENRLLSRHQQLKDISEEILGCTKCPLHETRTQAVPGEGAPNADIVFIGEAPGKREDELGMPFVGRSGQYLDRMLAMIGLQRESVFITNMVKCRPPENRDPKDNELDACQDYLDRQIALIDPIIIATLGRFSMARYFPKAKITQVHGTPKVENGRLYFPLFHPAAILRNRKMEPLMIEDFRRMASIIKQVKDGVPLSEIDEQDTPPDDNSPPQQMSLF